MKDDGGRIVVTGVGIASPLGAGAEAFWPALLAGRSAIAPIRSFDPGESPPGLGAEARDLPARELVPASQLRRMDRLSQMIVVAGLLAARSARLPDGADDDRAIVVGSGLGNVSESAQFLDRAFRKPSLANPMLFPNLVLNAPASQLAIALGWRGPNLSVSHGGISGEAALEAGVGLLRRGRARAVVAAAGDELSPVVFRALKDLGALSPRGGSREWASPFDRGANGPVAGEGAAALVLETGESAAARGARCLAAVEEVRRFALPASDPHRWPAAASPPGYRPGDAPDLVISGADSSPERDTLELSILSQASAGAVPLYSPKGAIGEWPSAGMTNLVIATLALHSGELPPLAALENPREAPGFTLPTRALRGTWRRALVLGIARGGAGIAVRMAASR